jgi:hypothetical protein
MKICVAIISFKETTLLKQGTWISAAAMVVFVAAPSMLNGDMWRHPAIKLFPLFILIGFWVYFLRKMPIYRAADEVVDCQDHLKVRRGRKEEAIPFSNISAAEVSTALRLHQITVRLKGSSIFGGQFTFLPQASLWSNPFGLHLLASSLTERAERASVEANTKGPSRSDNTLRIT